MRCRDVCIGFALLFLLIWAIGARAQTVVPPITPPTETGITLPGGGSASITVDLGETDETYSLPTVPAGQYRLQTYDHNVDEDFWEQSAPGGTYSNVGKFARVGLHLGHYDSERLLLFPQNSWSPIYDATYPVSFTVTTREQPIKSPTYSLGTPYRGTDGRIHFPWTLEWPSHIIWPAYSGVWIMAKSGGAFVQAWVSLSAAAYGTDPNQDIAVLKGTLTAADSTSTPESAQGGAFTVWWNAWSNWVWPGSLYEPAGSDWYTRCPVVQRPHVAQVYAAQGRSHVAFGANLGNYTCFGAWGTYGNYLSVPYLKALKAQTGCTWVRINLPSDLYLQSATFRDIVGAMREACWFAKVVPVFAFQDEPDADTFAEQDAKLLEADVMLAQQMADAPNAVIIENCNEPWRHATWLNDWQTLADKIGVAMRAVDPKGHFWCACEGESINAQAVNRYPLSRALYEAYDMHVYGAMPAQLLRRVPVIIGEYHDTTLAFHQQIEGLQNVFAAAAWAWALPGQDSLNLCKSWQNGVLTLTPDGTAIADVYTRLRTGK